jgi:hypothetical protein
MGSTSHFQWRENLSLQNIASYYRTRIVVTWLLLLGESITILLFPLAIGFAVDSLMAERNIGLVLLGLLCVGVLLFAAGRRFYDTRVYAAIYREMASTLVARKRERGGSTSKLTAQVNLLYEIIEFFENLLPALIGTAITFTGTILMLGFIDVWLMTICLITSTLVIGLYTLSENRILHYNRQQNNELERQVAVLEQNHRRRLDLHFGRLMKWNIKLSDLETLNFSAIWVLLASLLLLSIVLVVNNPVSSYGQKITAIMYVFEYIEAVLAFPLFYQQLIRLREITGRLSSGI